MENLDFNNKLFGNITDYKKLIISLLEALKSMTPETFWNIKLEGKKGLSSILVMEIIDLILDSYSEIADAMYADKMVAQEFPYFIEIKEMVECILLDNFYEEEEYLNLAIDLSADYFTLLEIKILLIDECTNPIEVPDQVMDEYLAEFSKYIKQFNISRDKFIAIYDQIYDGEDDISFS